MRKFIKYNDPIYYDQRERYNLLHQYRDHIKRIEQIAPVPDGLSDLDLMVFWERNFRDIITCFDIFRIIYKPKYSLYEGK